MRAAASLACLGWIVGCAASAVPPPISPALDDEPSGLVWLADAKGRHRTLWVSTVDGRPLASMPIEGPLWAEGSMLWQWIEEPVEIPLIDCANEPSAQSPAREIVGSAVGHRVHLRELTQSVSLEVRGPPRLEPLRTLSHGIEPIASVGPYLFAREEIAYVGCDAEAGTEARSLVWDLSIAGPTDVLSARERASVLARARAKLRERGLLSPARELELAMLAPRWDPRGGLELEVLFVGGLEPRATARMRAPRLPARLASRASVPPWVQVAVARTEGATLLGFSEIEHPAPARILAGLRR